jgi:rare lipoprotein A
MYAAHRELPLGTLLRVRNLKNGRRGGGKGNRPGTLQGGRVLDLSEGAARKLGMMGDGECPWRRWSSAVEIRHSLLCSLKFPLPRES